jgi:hypothetical protein
MPQSKVIKIPIRETPSPSPTPLHAGNDCRQVYGTQLSVCSPDGVRRKCLEGMDVVRSTPVEKEKLEELPSPSEAHSSQLSEAEIALPERKPLSKLLPPGVLKEVTETPTLLRRSRPCPLSPSTSGAVHAQNFCEPYPKQPQQAEPVHYAEMQGEAHENQMHLLSTPAPASENDMQGWQGGKSAQSYRHSSSVGNTRMMDPLTLHSPSHSSRENADTKDLDDIGANVDGDDSACEKEDGPPIFGKFLYSIPDTQTSSSPEAAPDVPPPPPFMAIETPSSFARCCSSTLPVAVTEGKRHNEHSLVDVEKRTGKTVSTDTACSIEGQALTGPCAALEEGDGGLSAMERCQSLATPAIKPQFVFKGFSSANGKSIVITDEALAKAERILESADDPGKAIATGTVSAGMGDGAPLSSEDLARKETLLQNSAARVHVENRAGGAVAADNPCSGTLYRDGRPAPKEHHSGSPALQRYQSLSAEALTSEPAPKVFSNAKGKRIIVTDEALAVANRRMQADPEAETAAMADKGLAGTGHGAPLLGDDVAKGGDAIVSVEERGSRASGIGSSKLQRLQRWRTLPATGSRVCPQDGISTPSRSEFVTPRKAQSTIFSGFSTAGSGKKVIVTEESLSKVGDIFKHDVESELQTPAKVTPRTERNLSGSGGLIRRSAPRMTPSWSGPRRISIPAVPCRSLKSPSETPKLAGGSSPVRKLGIRSLLERPKSLSEPEMIKAGVSLVVARLRLSDALSLNFCGDSPCCTTGSCCPRQHSSLTVLLKDALLAGGARADYIEAHPNWVENHARWIVWKLAGMERSWPKRFAGKLLLLSEIVHQLWGRYQVDLVNERQTWVKKILKRDASAITSVVLCVSEAIRAPPGPPLIQLTDSWYSITAVLDEGLTHFARSGRLQVGTKIAVAPSGFDKFESGIHPLDLQEGILSGRRSLAEAPKLKLSLNSTRVAHWAAKLGPIRQGRLLVPLCSVNHCGGSVSAVRVVVARVYPLRFYHEGRALSEEEWGGVMKAAQEAFSGGQLELADTVSTEAEMETARHKASEAALEAMPRSRRCASALIVCDCKKCCGKQAPFTSVLKVSIRELAARSGVTFMPLTTPTPIRFGSRPMM